MNEEDETRVIASRSGLLLATLSNCRRSGMERMNGQSRQQYSDQDSMKRKQKEEANVKRLFPQTLS